MPNISGNSAFTNDAKQDIRSSEQIFVDQISQKDKDKSEKPQNTIYQRIYRMDSFPLFCDVDSQFNLTNQIGLVNPITPIDINFWKIYYQYKVLDDNSIYVSTLSVKVYIQNIYSNNVYVFSTPLSGVTDYTITSKLILKYVDKDLKEKIIYVLNGNTYSYNLTSNTFNITQKRNNFSSENSLLYSEEKFNDTSIFLEAQKNGGNYFIAEVFDRNLISAINIDHLRSMNRRELPQTILTLKVIDN
jgi:hypothetical protein